MNNKSLSNLEIEASGIYLCLIPNVDTIATSGGVIRVGTLWTSRSRIFSLWDWNNFSKCNFVKRQKQLPAALCLHGLRRAAGGTAMPGRTAWIELCDDGQGQAVRQRTWQQIGQQNLLLCVRLWKYECFRQIFIKFQLLMAEFWSFTGIWQLVMWFFCVLRATYESYALGPYFVAFIM